MNHSYHIKKQQNNMTLKSTAESASSTVRAGAFDPRTTGTSQDMQINERAVHISIQSNNHYQFGREKEGGTLTSGMNTSHSRYVATNKKVVGGTGAGSGGKTNNMLQQMMQ